MIGAVLTLALQVAGEPAIINRARIDPRAEVSFHAIVRQQTVYVGQAVDYELGVFISNSMRQRLRRNPEFVPPELRSVLPYDIRERTASRIVEIDGRVYEVYVFRRALFPVAAGRIDIPPARLTYTVPLGASFFSREETYTLESEAVSFVALPPPESGRPDAWTGAIGDVSLRVVIVSRSARVGNPAVITLRVTGSGNVQLWPRPELDVEWATVVSGPERVIIDSLATRVRGTKEFDFLVTPTDEGRAIVPPVSYLFFDPASRRYRTVRSRPETLTVGAGEVVFVDTVSAADPGATLSPVRRAWSRAWPDSPQGSIWYWILALLAPIPAVVRVWKQRVRVRGTPASAGVLGGFTVRRGTPAVDVQHAFKRALERRLRGSEFEWADARAVRRTLRHRGVTDQTVERILTLVADLDRVTYGGDPDPLADAGERALALYGAVDNEAQRVPSTARALRRTAAIAMLVAPLPAMAQQGSDARTLFDHAVRTYDEGEFRDAAASFFEAARLAPRSAAAWANAGTASWVAADTALAVVAWQRALRLNPLDSETRDRLVRAGADAGSARSAVWPIPRRSLGWIAIALWLGAWLQLARGRTPRRAFAGAAAGLIIGAVSYAHGRRLIDPTLAVVASPTALRTLPALGAESGPAPLAGEIVHVVEQRGVWVRIEAVGSRAGWIDGARLLNLDGRPLRD